MMPSASSLWTATIPRPAKSTAKRLLLFTVALVCLLPSLRAQSDPPIPTGDVRIHYFRPDGNYAGWALYTWNASTENASWCGNEVQISGTDAYGVYFDVSVNPAWGTPTGDLGFIIDRKSVV